MYGKGQTRSQHACPLFCYERWEYMSWSKLKQQLEGFLSPALEGRVEYRAPGYRYLPGKSGI